MFIYKNEKYPRYLIQTDEHEVIEVLIPEPTGDYFLAVIDSDGACDVKDFIAAADVSLDQDKVAPQ